MAAVGEKGAALQTRDGIPVLDGALDLSGQGISCLGVELGHSCSAEEGRKRTIQLMEEGTLSKGLPSALYPQGVDYEPLIQLGDVCSGDTCLKRHVTKLDLSFNALYGVDLKDWPILTHLNLRGNPTGIVILRNMPNLKFLDLRETKMPDSISAELLSRADLPNLEFVYFTPGPPRSTAELSHKYSIRRLGEIDICKIKLHAACGTPLEKEVAKIQIEARKHADQLELDSLTHKPFVRRESRIAVTNWQADAILTAAEKRGLAIEHPEHPKIQVFLKDLAAIEEEASRSVARILSKAYLAIDSAIFYPDLNSPAKALFHTDLDPEIIKHRVKFIIHESKIASERFQAQFHKQFETVRARAPDLDESEKVALLQKVSSLEEGISSQFRSIIGALESQAGLIYEFTIGNDPLNQRGLREAADQKQAEIDEVMESLFSIEPTEEAAGGAGGPVAATPPSDPTPTYEEPATVEKAKVFGENKKEAYEMLAGRILDRVSIEKVSGPKVLANQLPKLWNESMNRLSKKEKGKISQGLSRKSITEFQETWRSVVTSFPEGEKYRLAHFKKECVKQLRRVVNELKRQHLLYRKVKK